MKKKGTQTIKNSPEVIAPPALVSLFTLTLWYVLVLIVSIVLGLILRLNTISLPVDRFFYELIYTMPHPVWLTDIVAVIDQNFLPILHPHPSFLVLTYILFLTYMLVRKRQEFLWAFLSLALGLILISIILFIDTHLVFRTRPFFILPNHVAKGIVEGLKGWTSYPSGHTRDSMLIAMIMSYFIPSLRYIFIFLACFVGFTRIYLGVHFPTDVFAGLLIGFFVGQITILTIVNLRQRYEASHKSK